MTGRPAGGTMPVERARAVLGWAAAGVAFYVGSWLLSGLLIPGFDARTRAISETFDLGAPIGTRILMTVALVATGALLVAFGPALDRLAPGTGRAAPLLAMASGVATVLVAAAPCTAGCPGFGTTPLDTLHVSFAAFGYACLIAAPMAFAVRVRDHRPRLARASLAIGLVAGALFLGSTVIDTGFHGLVQRTYNTLADAWYVVVAVALGAHRTRPDRA